VLHCLARLHEIAIPGATQGATRRNTGATFFTAPGGADRHCVGIQIPFLLCAFSFQLSTFNFSLVPWSVVPWSLGQLVSCSLGPWSPFPLSSFSLLLFLELFSQPCDGTNGEFRRCYIVIPYL